MTPAVFLTVGVSDTRVSIERRHQCIGLFGIVVTSTQLTKQNKNTTATASPLKTFVFFAVHCKPFHRSQVHFMMAYAWNLTCDHRSNALHCNVMINSENDTSFSPRPDLCFYLYLSFGELLFYSVELGPLSIFNQEFVFSRAFVYEHCICIYAHCICI